MKRIGIYAGKNLLRIILLLFAVSILTFALVSASPIDPLQANVGQAALGSMSEEQKEKLRSYWGVDEPPVQRYLNWLNAFIKGDGGISLLYRQPVTKVIAVKLGNSLFLMGLAWVVSGLVGFLLGVIAGVFKRLFAGDCQYSFFLAGAFAVDHFWSLDENPSHWT